jgi:hypothetical protein
MKKRKLEKQLRNFDLFCLLNSCGQAGGCDIATIRCLLRCLNTEIDPPTTNPPPTHLLLYLNNTNYGVSISFSHPYFYSITNNWRRYHSAAQGWAKRIAAFEPDEWKAFAPHFTWGHPFPITLAFLTYRAWQMSKDTDIFVERLTIKPTDIKGDRQTINGITKAAIIWDTSGAAYLMVQSKMFLMQGLSSASVLKITGAARVAYANWLGTVLLLTEDNLAKNI